MDKLMDPQSVKTYHRKAMMLCHPDKVKASGDPDKVYIASRCFAALTDAYNIFKVILTYCTNRPLQKEENIQ